MQTQPQHEEGPHCLRGRLWVTTLVRHEPEYLLGDLVVFADRTIRLKDRHDRLEGVPVDARHPLKYRMLVPMVDVVFADVAQPDQARIVALNAAHFLKNGGHFVISIKASCIDSTAAPEAVFAREVKKLQEGQLKPKEQVTLEPYERDHAVVVGVFRPPPKVAKGA